MKKLLSFFLILSFGSFAQKIQFKDFPTTTTGTTADYLIKDRADGGSGATQKMTVGNFLLTYIPNFSNLLNGSLTTNYIPKATGTYALANSSIYDNGTNVGISTTSPVFKLDVSGLTRSRGLIASGVAATTNGGFGLYNSTNSNVLTIQPSVFGASYAWTMPTGQCPVTGYVITVTSGGQWGYAAMAGGATGPTGPTGSGGGSTGTIVIKHINNTVDTYTPASNTDASRGTMLGTALAALNAGDAIYIGAGSYKYESTITVLPNTTYIGEGAIIYHSTNTITTFSADSVDNWTIKGFALNGSNVGTGSPTESAIWERYCLGWRVENTNIKNFKYQGITTVGYADSKRKSGDISNVNIDTCKVGINLGQRSEFNFFQKCRILGCDTGVSVTGGNNFFNQCQIMQSTACGLTLHTGGNDGHGEFTGCAIEHNAGFSIIMNQTSAETFTGCHIYNHGLNATDGYIQLLNNGSGRFDNCILGAPIEATGTLVNTTIFQNCKIDTFTVSTLTAPQATHVLFLNCQTSKLGPSSLNNPWPINTGGTNNTSFATGLNFYRGGKITNNDSLAWDGSHKTLDVGMISPNFNAKGITIQNPSDVAQIFLLNDNTASAASIYLGPKTLSTSMRFEYYGSTISASGMVQQGSGALRTVGMPLQIGTNGTDNFTLWSNNTERIRIDGGGNVGINNASPSVSLDVTGASKISTSLTCPIWIGGTAAGSSTEIRSTSGTGTTDFIKFTLGTNGGTEGGRFLTGGQLLLGYTSLTGAELFGIRKDQNATTYGSVYNANANGSAISSWYCSNGTNNGQMAMLGTGYTTNNMFVANRLIIGSGSTAGVGIYASDVTGVIRFASGGNTEKMQLDASGNLGIGTTSPNSTLHVSGSIAKNYIAKTANYTLTASDYLINCTANSFTLTMPTAVGIMGREYVLKNVGSGIITLATTSSQTIDGIATGVLTLVQNDKIIIESDGANWIITGGYNVAPALRMYDSNTQAIATPGTPQLVTFSGTTLTRKVVATSSSRFTVNEAGWYDARVEAQLSSSAVGKTMDLWYRVNGSDIAASLTKNQLVNILDQKDVTHSVPLNLAAGDYVEIWINGDDAGLALQYNSAGSTPIRPSAPSIYFSLTKIQ